jgi:hypothetical protein
VVDGSGKCSLPRLLDFWLWQVSMFHVEHTGVYKFHSVVCNVHVYQLDQPGDNNRSVCLCYNTSRTHLQFPVPMRASIQSNVTDR